MLHVRIMTLLFARLACAAALLLVAPSPSTCAGGPKMAPLDARERAEVVRAIGEVLLTFYFDEEVAKRCDKALRALLERGELDRYRRPDEFAARLTAELRRLANDRHMEVVVRPPEPSTTPGAPPRDWREDLRLRGYDVRRVEMLDGGVGYLDLRSFPPPAVARPAVDAAMTLLANADVVIIDLRRNSGGTGEMVELLASWFLPARTHLATAYKRRRGEARESRTLADVPHTRLRAVPLYLLTSQNTFSAAESFAYELQARRRAVVVGERTRGGANPGGYEPVGDRFLVFCADVQVISAATGTNWEGVGVQPDLPVKADEALTAAHRAALRRRP
jgi:retinol-binding protein 3